MDEQLKSIVEVLKDLEGDNGVPRNVKDRIKTVIIALKDTQDIKLGVNKALHELDEVNDDPNLQPYIRTQIWNVVSLLESIE